MRAERLSIRGLGMTAALTALVSASSSPAGAQQLELSVTPMAITLPRADPDAVPVLSSSPVQVSYRIRGNGTRPWLLTVLAGGDLISSTSSVDISNVRWIASPAPPFQNGTLHRTVEQAVASGVGNVNPAAQGTITFQLANSWSYEAGLYTQTLVFTLTSP